MPDIFSKIEEELEIETNIEKQQQNKKNEENDFEFAREKMRDIILVGEKAISDLADLASQTNEARHFEVLGTLIDKTVAAAKALTNEHLEKTKLKKMRKEMETPKEDSVPQIGQVTNNLIVGNLNDILKQIDNNKKDVIDV